MFFFILISNSRETKLKEKRSLQTKVDLGKIPFLFKLISIQQQKFRKSYIFFILFLIEVHIIVLLMSVFLT